MLICHFSFQNITIPNWENSQVSLRLSICHQIEGCVTRNQLLNLLFGSNRFYWLAVAGHLLLPDSSSSPITSDPISSELGKAVGVTAEVTLLLLSEAVSWVDLTEASPKVKAGRAQPFPR